jgi:hypothetical protein
MSRMVQVAALLVAAVQSLFDTLMLLPRGDG